MIKILHIVDILDRGGVQTWLQILTEGLAKKGYQQYVLCLNRQHNKEIVEFIRSKGVKVKMISRYAFFSGYGFYILLSEIRKFQPDIVKTILPYSDMIGRPLAHFAGVPCIISSIHDRYLYKLKLQFIIDRITAKWVDKFIFVAKEIIPFSVKYEGVPQDKTVAIPNSIHLRELLPESAADAKRKELKIDRNIKIIAMVARLAPQKSQKYLIEAFAKLTEKYPDTVLLLIGRGDDRKKLERQAMATTVKEKILFLGDRSDVWELLNIIDIFVHSTQHEGLPYSVMEAMSAGKPVIASKVDGVNSLIEDGVNGLLIPPLDAESILKSVSYLLDTPQLRRTLGDKARKHIADNFSAEKMIAAYDREYRELVESGREKGVQL